MESDMQAEAPSDVPAAAPEVDDEADETRELREVQILQVFFLHTRFSNHVKML
jgi:hypothetical protein